MLTALFAALVFTLASAFAAIVLGRNLTRSLAAGMVFMTGLGLSLLIAGAGFQALVVVVLGALMLATIQIFGWMLVDIDRDHLPPTDRPTWIARSLAFLLVGGGLGLLAMSALVDGEFAILGPRSTPATPVEIGELLYGRLRGVTILIGLAIAAGLLSVLTLLKDDESRGER